MSYCCRIGLTLALVVLVSGRPAGGLAQDRVYVAVADNKGKPVAGLTAADFQVAVDGKDQEIASVAPATGPVSVVIITDRLGLESSYNTFAVHRALAAFVKGVHGKLPDSLFALTTFDGPVVRIVGFSSPTGGFDRAIGRLATNATDAAMLDALKDATEVLSTATTERRAIFAMFAGYRPDLSREWNDTAALALWQSKASLWAIEVRSSGANSFGNTHREQVVNQGSQMSGGMAETVGSAIGLDAMTQRMAALLANQYVITYGPDGGGATGSRRSVTIARKGLRVLAPSWNPR
jgi:Ca-activated chloride channel family protein